MLNKDLKSIKIKSMEFVIVVIVVFIFFSIYLLLLDSLFFSGTSIKKLINRGERPFFKRSLSASIQELQIETNREIAGINPKLIKKTNDVKVKRASAISWEPAYKEMSLYHRDAVQTFNDSSAVISLDTNNNQDSIIINENTLIIIKCLESDPFLGTKHSVLDMSRGIVRANITGTESELLKVEINTPSAVAKVTSPKGSNSHADLTITVNSDNSSTVTVYKGNVEVAAEGQVVQVDENQGITVKPGEAPTVPTMLRPPPALSKPDEGEMFYYRDLSPKIRFVWEALPHAELYHFALAKDFAFQQLVEDIKISNTIFIHGNLKSGEYYWRVSGIEGESEGQFSEIRKVHIVQDAEAPFLEVQFPDQIMAKSEDIIIKGVTEPGAFVFVQAESVLTDKNGEFNYTFHPKTGINSVVVEAVDAAGNVAYKTHKFYVGGSDS